MMRRICLMIVFSVLSLNPCARSICAAEPGKAEEGKSKARIPEDRSLTVDAYIEMGMPSPDRLWSVEDYAGAARVLNKLLEEAPHKLPRHESNKSGVLFSRMCSLRNLDAAKDRKSSIRTRMQFSGRLFTELIDILWVYGKANEPNGHFGDECAELTVLMLHTLAVAFDCSDEFLASLPPDDPKRGIRAASIELLQHLFTVTLQGMLAPLSKRETYGPDARLRVAECLQDVLPALLPRLPLKTQEKISARLQRTSKEEADETLKAALERLLKLIEVEKEKKSDPATEEPAA